MKNVSSLILDEYRLVIDSSSHQSIDSPLLEKYVAMKPMLKQRYPTIRSKGDFFVFLFDCHRRISRRRKLLYELNSTGKYFAFKEQLKHSVVKIVREKFLRTSKFNNPDELQVKKKNFSLLISADDRDSF